jgi:acyl carrier protein
MALTAQAIEDRIKKATAQVLRVPVDKIQSDSRFKDDLGADSLQSVELVAAFEDEFDIEMDEDEATKVQSIKEAVAYIQQVIAA